MKQSTKDAINRHVEFGNPAGSFVTAVLENNLSESFGQADEENRRDMFDIVCYCYNNIPSSCWGSKKAVEDWMNLGGLEGIKKTWGE